MDWRSDSPAPTYSCEEIPGDFPAMNALRRTMKPIYEEAHRHIEAFKAAQKAYWAALDAQEAAMRPKPEYGLAEYEADVEHADSLIARELYDEASAWIDRANLRYERGF